MEFQGALSSINGRDRSEAFKECMTKKYPNIKVFEIATDWEGTKASAGLNTVLAQTNNSVQGIYMQAGGVVPRADPAGPPAEEPARAGR